MKFVISLYKDGKHDQPVKQVNLSAQPADVPSRISSMRGISNYCCWEASSDGASFYKVCEAK